MTIDQALATPYEFEFRDRRYFLSPITLGIKGRLGKFLKQRLLAQGREVLSREEYDEFRARTLAGDGGTTSVATLLEALKTPEGARFLLRCSIKPQTPGEPPPDDATLDAMLATDVLAQVYELLAAEIGDDPKKAVALLRDG